MDDASLCAAYHVAETGENTAQANDFICQQWKERIEANDLDAIRRCWVHAAKRVNINTQKYMHMQFPDLDDYRWIAMGNLSNMHSDTLDSLWYLQMTAKYCENEEMATKVLEACHENVVAEYPEVALDCIYTILACKTTQLPSTPWLQKQIDALPISAKTIYITNSLRARNKDAIQRKTTAKAVVAEAIVLRFMPPISKDSRVSVYAEILRQVELGDRAGTLLIVMDTAGYVEILSTMGDICTLQANFLLSYIANTHMVGWSFIDGKHLIDAIEILAHFATREHAWDCFDAISAVLPDKKWKSIYSAQLRRSHPSRLTIVDQPTEAAP